jgi:hypothetical protein
VDGVEAGTFFVPGQNGTLSWNTTAPIRQKPILLYVFDGHTLEGSNFEYSAIVENKAFKDEKVIREARGFICEKICTSDHEFLREVEGREPVTKFISTSLKDPKKRNAKVFLLDASGQLIASFEGEKFLKTSAPAMAKMLKKAKKENQGRIKEDGSQK